MLANSQASVDRFYCSLRWRNKKSYILSAVVFYSLYIVKALRFLAIFSIVWLTFLKSRNVIWQSAYEAYRVHHSAVVA